MRDRPAVELPGRLLPLLGELAWHSLTRDPSIVEVSGEHLASIRETLSHHSLPRGEGAVRFLEIAPYAHVTAYRLAEEGVDATLFDLSPHTLRLGRDVARAEGIGGEATRVAGDFHDLPFSDGFFDLVYMASALHHTEEWGTVLDEAFRVLRPGGILLLENEPTAREACFHRFRSNRAESRTPFEAALHEAGLLRTVAEPYPGSRPEELFGMTENQRIPLSALLGRALLHGELEEARIDTNATTGEMERRWIRYRRLGRHANAFLIGRDLRRGFDAAAKTMTDVDGGLGFSLPSREETGALARRVARSLARMGRRWDERVVAETFGAPVRLVLRKRGDRGSPRPSSPWRRPCPEEEGVRFGFDEALNRFFPGLRSTLPEVRKGTDEALSRHFPRESWEIRRDGEGNGAAWLSGRSGEIVLDGEEGRKLLLMRIHGQPGNPPPVAVHVRQGDRVLHSFRLWRREAHVVARIVECAPHERIRVERDGAEGGEGAPFLLVPSLFCIPLDR